MEDSPEEKIDPRPDIPKPNLDDLQNWTKEVINQPSISYATGAEKDGTPLTPQEQLDLTRQQIINLASEQEEIKKHPNPKISARALTPEALKTTIIETVRVGNLSSKFK